MNNALISPLEQIYSFDGTLIGVRIADTSQNTFEVAEPLYWIECANEVVADQWYFQSQTASCQPVPIPPIPIPTQVSMRQARLALFQDGLLDQVQSAIDAMAEPAKTTTQISWDYATVVNRDDDLVVQLSAQLGLTSEDLDALFTLAATL